MTGTLSIKIFVKVFFAHLKLDITIFPNDICRRYPNLWSEKLFATIEKPNLGGFYMESLLDL